MLCRGDVKIVRDINKNYLDNLFALIKAPRANNGCVRYVNEIPLTNRVRGPYRELRTEFFPPRFMAQARTARAINRRGKNEDP